MSQKTVRLELTLAEAIALSSAAENGFDHGSFFVEPDGRSTGYGNGKRSVEAYERADEKLTQAINRVGGFKRKAVSP